MLSLFFLMLWQATIVVSRTNRSPQLNRRSHSMNMSFQWNMFDMFECLACTDFFHCVTNTMSITSLGVVPGTLSEKAKTLSCKPSTIAWRWRATPTPERYFASASPFYSLHLKSFLCLCLLPSSHPQPCSCNQEKVHLFGSQIFTIYKIAGSFKITLVKKNLTCWRRRSLSPDLYQLLSLHQFALENRSWRVADENPSSSSPILGFLRKVLKNSYLLLKLCDQLSPLILTCSWSPLISLLIPLILACSWSSWISFLIPLFAHEDLWSAPLHWLLLACSSRPLIGFTHLILGRSWSSLISNISSQITKNTPETLCNHKTLITVSSFRIDNKQCFMISRSFDNGSRSLETIDRDLQQK